MLHPVGAGALGPVFRAYDPGRDRFIALKIFRLELPPERAHKAVAALDTLIAGGLTHPALVIPLAAGITDVSPYLAQDFVTGESLDVLLRDRGPMAPGDALRLVSEAAAALDHVAAKGLVHGGLHPRDVVMSVDGPRISGVGIVTALDAAGFSAPTRRPYVAPERAAGARWDRRADGFSLAAIAFEVLSGRRVAGLGEQAARGMISLTGADMPALRRVFAQALAADPAERFPEAAAFAEALALAFDAPRAASERLPFARRELNESSSPWLGATPLLDAAAPRPRERRTRPEPELSLPLGDEPTTSDIPVATPPPASVPATSSLMPAQRSASAQAPLASAEPPTAANRVGALERPPQIRVPVERPLAAEAPTSSRIDVPAPLRSEAATSRITFGASLPLDDEARVERTPRAAFTVWPLIVSLGIGLAVGFAGGYGVGIRESAEDRRLSLSASEPAVADDPAAARAGASSPAVPAELRPSEPRAATPGAAAAPAAVASPPAPASAPSSSATVPSAPAGTPAPAASLPGAGSVPATARASTAPPIVVRSTPSGAHVRLDGRDVGATPLTLKDVSPGSHTIRLSLDGYTTAERRILVDASHPVGTVALQLAPSRRQQAGDSSRAAPGGGSPGKNARSTGALEIDSRPAGARVYVDGKLVGNTPLQLPAVEAGDHGVRLELDGYRGWTSSIKVEGGGRNRVAASLEP